MMDTFVVVTMQRRREQFEIVHGTYHPRVLGQIPRKVPSENHRKYSTALYISFDKEKEREYSLLRNSIALINHNANIITSNTQAHDQNIES